MKMIARLVDMIKEEVDGAEAYAEQYLEYKAEGNDQWAMRYKEMAQDELKHAILIHTKAVEDIERLKKVYTPPKFMLDRWEDIHHDYVEQTETIKKMLGN